MNQAPLPPKLILLAVQQGREDHSKRWWKNASLDTPSCLPQKRLQLSLDFYGRQSYCLDPVAQ